MAHRRNSDDADVSNERAASISRMRGHVHADADTRAHLEDSHLEGKYSVRIAKAVGAALKAKQAA